MDKELFSELESSASRNRSAKKWAFYISIGLIVALISDNYFRHVDSISLGFEVFLTGISVAFWLISYDREKRDLDRLNNFCLKKFGKEYERSGDEIINLKFPKK
ncbi:hypothetical protein ACT3RT_13875 [Ewingella sp. AOP9-I1-14]